MPPLELSMEDNNKHIQLAVGKVATVCLQGNPTTGYGWTRIGFEKTHEQSDDTFKITSAYKPATPGLIGGGGKFYISVTPLKTGTHKLELAYARPFEGIKPNDSRFTLTIESAQQ